MIAALDLSDIPLVDDHCHAIYRDQHPANLEEWRAAFAESTDRRISYDHVRNTLFFNRLVHHLAEIFECEPTEESVFAARSELGTEALVHTLMARANIDTLVVDQGFPPPNLAMPDTEMGRLASCRIAPVLRLEVLMQDLIARHETLPGVVEALRDELSHIRARGFVGLKSIVAYRTGLYIERWHPADVEASFAAARAEVQERGAVRIAHKPLLDTLLHVAFEQAARQEVPVQFHTGYGDTDADMILANPLYLRNVLQDAAYRDMPVVLLHESYPYTRQAGYLSAVYGNVYLDLSYAIPFLSYGAMVEFTREAFGVAPLSKVLYASDAVHVPELYWMSAVDGRRVIGQVLGEMIQQRDLSRVRADHVAEGILRGNALRLYGLQEETPDGVTEQPDFPPLEP